MPILSLSPVFQIFFTELNSFSSFMPLEFSNGNTLRNITYVPCSLHVSISELLVLRIRREIN